MTSKELREKYFSIYSDRKLEKDKEFKESLYTEWLEQEYASLQTKEITKDRDAWKETANTVSNLNEKLENEVSELTEKLKQYESPSKSDEEIIIEVTGLYNTEVSRDFKKVAELARLSAIQDKVWVLFPDADEIEKKYPTKSGQWDQWLKNRQKQEGINWFREEALKRVQPPPPTAQTGCKHEWDEGHHSVSKCKICGKFSA